MDSIDNAAEGDAHLQAPERQLAGVDEAINALEESSKWGYTGGFLSSLGISASGLISAVGLHYYRVTSVIPAYAEARESAFDAAAFFGAVAVVFGVLAIDYFVNAHSATRQVKLLKEERQFMQRSLQGGQNADYSASNI